MTKVSFLKEVSNKNRLSHIKNQETAVLLASGEPHLAK